MNKVRWGVLGTAKIAIENVIPAMQLGYYSEIIAIASRNPDRAHMVADKFGIPIIYGSYEEIMEDERIDAIYIPLPNHLHIPWSIRALEAGKHVLCEKPIGLNLSESKKLLSIANKYPHLKIAEAFMYRCHPQWSKAKQLVREGQIGD